MERENRRLAAIVAADIAAYSRLIGQDEEGTLRALRAHRTELIDALIVQHGGRIANTAGDSLLLEFPSAVDAVRCAIAVQEGMAVRNGEIEADRRIAFRIGINVGDVVAEGKDLLGDGVNVAARLEGLCEPGGLCLSATAHDYVSGNVTAEFVDDGEHELKNIERPVHVWRWSKIEGAGTADAGAVPQPPANKPSIAVLPFDNMSSEAEQEYFCDGVVEDIITELSKFRWLSVIARNSTFTYKGKTADVKSIGEELGARYVVEGSVRKAGERIRINAQLIDSGDGSHVWAERYDRQLTDIFDLQDEITQTLVATIEPELAAVERGRARNRPTEILGAWELLQKALWYRYRYTAEAYDTAESLLAESIALDPGFAAAHATMGWMCYARVIMGYSDDPEKHLQEGARCARTAIELDDREALAYCTLNAVQTMMTDYDSALTNIDHVIELNPNYAQAHMLRALTLVLAADDDVEAIRQSAEMGMKLSPKDPMTWNSLMCIGETYFDEGNLETAAKYFDSACQQPVTNYWPHISLATCLKLLNREEEAKSALATALEMNPALSIAIIQRIVSDKIKSKPNWQISLNALRELGLPET